MKDLVHASRGMKKKSLMLAHLITAAVVALPVVAAAQGVQNPLNSAFSTIPTFIAGFLKAMVMLALPVVALFLVISGFKFVSAQGNPGKLSEAKENFVYVIIGALLILGAWVIATLINGTVSQLVN
ncbi:hypothetical protein HY968_02085 [Candidatus Kaiserbacteria bacterium]|nr:hypothetical protein [Candidatus Kaiserbacteria bacterium]